MSNEQSKVIQIIPANNTKAVYYDAETGLRRLPVVCWALLEDGKIYAMEWLNRTLWRVMPDAPDLLGLEFDGVEKNWAEAIAELKKR